VTNRNAAERRNAACARIAEHVAALGRRGSFAARRIAIMEVCGTHTVAIHRAGLRGLLPAQLKLVSGPGCPVCVTPQSYVDALIDLSHRPGVRVATYGDMIRVPGRQTTLERAQGSGARVAIVYSVMDALDLARRNPAEQIVFAGVGFETTTPPTAVAVKLARQEQLANFTVLSAHKLILPAMAALLSGGQVLIDGFLLPGHVSVILGSDAYRPVAAQFGKPCVVAGFEPQEMLDAIERILAQLAAGHSEVENAYPRAVSAAGNRAAWAVIEEVFQPADTPWRGLGTIPGSGLALRDAFAAQDAARRFGITVTAREDDHGCRCGQVICGLIEPLECPLFATACTPANPVGPCMVSREGNCQAHYKYARNA
jgi:hydrogenase expression/formation protein HypD